MSCRRAPGCCASSACSSSTMTRDASVDSPDRTPSRVRGVMSTCSRTRSAGWRMTSCLETYQLALTRAAEVTDIPGNRFRYQICPGVLPWKAPVRQPGDGRTSEPGSRRPTHDKRRQTDRRKPLNHGGGPNRVHLGVLNSVGLYRG